MSAKLPVVHVTEQGPYRVENPTKLRLVRAGANHDSHGAPNAWGVYAELEWQTDADGVAWLCRCGGSVTKPFCSNMHPKVKWDGTETAPTDTYDDRALNFPVEGVVLRDDRSLCTHASFCVSSTSDVWEMLGDGSAAVRDHMQEMIHRCPSGRLAYRPDRDADDVEPELEPTVWVIDDCQYVLTGGVQVVRADGTQEEPRNRISLCRCGQSTNKPYCDGTHFDVKFTDAGRRESRPFGG